MEWKEYKISEITTGIYEGPHATPPHAEKGGLYLGIPNMRTDGMLDFSSPKYISDEDIPKWNKRVTPQEGDVLFTNEATLHLYALVPPGFYGSLGRRVALLRLKKEIVDNRFLLYYFCSPIWRAVINQEKFSGATVERISMIRFPDFKVRLPDLATQRRISSILSSLDRKIELNNKINATLEEMAQALFKSWFVDFEPFKNGNFIDTEIGKIPEGWRVGTLFDVADVLDSKRKPLSSRQRDAMQKIYPYYGATCCMDYVDDYLFDGIYTLIGEDGSVVKENGLPYMQYVWGKIWVNNHAHVLQGKNGFSTELLHCMLSLTPINHLVTGAVQAKLSQGNMKKIQIAIPPMEVLKQIVPKIDELYNQLRINSQETLTLTHLRDTLLPRLMSGEIELEDTL